MLSNFWFYPLIPQDRKMLQLKTFLWLDFYKTFLLTHSGEYNAFAQEEELGDFRGTAFAKVPRDRHKWGLEHIPSLFFKTGILGSLCR